MGDGPPQPSLAARSSSAPPCLDTQVARMSPSSSVSVASCGSASVASTSCATIVPLPFRKPENSVGSHWHITGECKPCAWFWRTQGCSNGELCRHCHSCEEGALKKQKKKAKEARNAMRAAAEIRLPVLLGNTKPAVLSLSDMLGHRTKAP